MRLDKYLAHAGLGTRSEVKKLIRSGRVFLNGTAAKRAEENVEADDEVQVDGELVEWSEHVYFMLNKPAGVVSATKDSRERTVVDLIDCPHSSAIFPVGRLDKDTEGLLLLTDDGKLAHELLAPGKHVEKTYQVWVSGKVTKEEKRLLEEGVDIGDDTPTHPAVLCDICYYDAVGNLVGGLNEKDEMMSGSGEIVQSRLEIVITEGRYHQIKRMFGKVGKQVEYLRRIAMGGLSLDEELPVGAYRKLTEEELNNLKRKKLHT